MTARVTVRSSEARPAWSAGKGRLSLTKAQVAVTQGMVTVALGRIRVARFSDEETATEWSGWQVRSATLTATEMGEGRGRPWRWRGQGGAGSTAQKGQVHSGGPASVGGEGDGRRQVPTALWEVRLPL